MSEPQSSPCRPFWTSCAGRLPVDPVPLEGFEPPHIMIRSHGLYPLSYRGKSDGAWWMCPHLGSGSSRPTERPPWNRPSASSRPPRVVFRHVAQEGFEPPRPEGNGFTVRRASRCSTAHGVGFRSDRILRTRTTRVRTVPTCCYTKPTMGCWTGFEPAFTGITVRGINHSATSTVRLEGLEPPTPSL
jgi:hypothetical protein